MYIFYKGKVTEWSIVLAWNASEPYGSQGSNPCLSANTGDAVTHPREPTVRLSFL